MKGGGGSGGGRRESFRQGIERGLESMKRGRHTLRREGKLMSFRSKGASFRKRLRSADRTNTKQDEGSVGKQEFLINAPHRAAVALRAAVEQPVVEEVDLKELRGVLRYAVRRKESASARARMGVRARSSGLFASRFQHLNVGGRKC